MLEVNFLLKRGKIWKRNIEAEAEEKNQHEKMKEAEAVKTQPEEKKEVEEKKTEVMKLMM